MKFWSLNKIQWKTSKFLDFFKFYVKYHELIKLNIFSVIFCNFYKIK